MLKFEQYIYIYISFYFFDKNTYYILIYIIFSNIHDSDDSVYSRSLSHGNLCALITVLHSVLKTNPHSPKKKKIALFLRTLSVHHMHTLGPLIFFSLIIGETT